MFFICSLTIIAIFFNHKLLAVQDLIDHAFEMRDMRIHIRYHSFQRHSFLVIARRIIMHFLIAYSRMLYNIVIIVAFVLRLFSDANCSNIRLCLSLDCETAASCRYVSAELLLSLVSQAILCRWVECIHESM